MMSRQGPPQSELFGAPKDLGAHVPANHLLRQVLKHVDFDFAYEKVEHLYGPVGQESVPPPVILKLMLLLTLYDVHSERELMGTVPYRIDWLWFLGYTLDSKTPNHSVLSKARRRWGAKPFEAFFKQVLDQCRSAKLVGGTNVHTDASFIEANASIDSLFASSKDSEQVVSTIVRRLDEVDAEEGDESDDRGGGGTDEQARKRKQHRKTGEPSYRSKTDPDATGAKQGRERMRPRYKTHRVVDDLAGVITSTHVSPGHENEATHLSRSLDHHRELTGVEVTTLAADSKYGTLENLMICEEREITAYIPPFRSNYSRPKNRFGDCEFLYDAASDTYTCPAGQKLIRKRRRAERGGYLYTAPRSACAPCAFRSWCTRSKNAPRSLLRNDRHDLLDTARTKSRSETGRAYRTRRMWLMEGSFAQSKRYGYKRARWRGLNRVLIQDLLVATAVNLKILLREKLEALARRFADWSVS